MDKTNSMVEQPKLDFQPFQSPFRDNPYAFFAQAREQPIFFSPTFNFWMVTRYDDIVQILKDHQRFSNRKAFAAPTELVPEAKKLLQNTMFGTESGGLIMADPPIHTRLRRPLTAAFSARRVAKMEPALRELVSRLIDSFPPQGPVDFVESFAHPLPIQAVCHLLGVPQSDLEQIRVWSDALIDLLNAGVAPEKQVEYAQKCVELYQYMRDLLEQRRRNPQDDLCSALIQEVEKEQSQTSLAELADVLVSVQVAGFESTQYFLSGFLSLILTNVDWENLNEDPRNLSLLVEEGLRLATPILGIMRYATQEVQVGGVTIPAGALVYTSLTSGNYDDQQFAHAALFDPQREQNNRHITFGQGIHFCIGAPLARAEARIAIDVLHQRLPHLRLVPDQPLEYLDGLVLRGLKHLWIERGE
ncbi:MAG TPA: cytochrome P450 [Ktedonobacteraceae bacterium]|nr:cytochrome P450 [Ktedonobacteraceae bacterium]